MLNNINKSNHDSMNYRITNLLLLFFIGIILSPIVKGQIVTDWKEYPALAKNIKDVIPEGKALFVFETSENFVFDSDNENITQPLKQDQLYKLFVSVKPSAGAITIHHDMAEKATINYGRFMLESTLPALKNGEIRYFKLSLVPRLACYDVTKKKKLDGASDFQGLYEKEALIIVNVIPRDLEINIVGDKITKIIKEKGIYKVYVQPDDQFLYVKYKNYKDEPIPLDDLSDKDVRYYVVETPQIHSNNVVESVDPNTKVGNYSIESNPSGALIQMTGRPDFNKFQYKTPYTIEGYKSGTEIITISLDRYEIIKDTIVISSSKGKKSKYNLVPKFAFINCNIDPPIPVSKVLLDGIELFPIKDGIDFECNKGSHQIEINAPHYYSEYRQINLAAGKTSEINIKLKPKMGSLSVLGGDNSSGSEVFINNKKVGEVPITNLILQEGTYTVNFKKSGYISEKAGYMIEVNENKLTNFKDLKMINTKKVRINTKPVTGATVYIDGNLISDKTNLSLTLGVGAHSVRIEREHYKSLTKSIVVDQWNDEFTFSLDELSYPVLFNTKPSNSELYIDGILKGTTPVTLDVPLGKHKVTYNRENSLMKRNSISINKPTTITTKLFPANYYILGGDYGLEQYRFNFGFVVSGFLVSTGLQINERLNSFNENDLAIKNVVVADINIYDKEDGRIYDTAKISFNFKLGYTIKKPIVFIITAGCSFIQTDKFQKVYSAKHDYISENNGQIIYKGDFFSEPYLTKNAYTAFTAGIMLPIARTLYVSAEYYSNSNIGPGFTFGLGFMLGTKLK